MTIFLYILVGLSIGLISGALGIGGGILLIPILMWGFGFEHRKAIGTTLGVMVPPIGLGAAIRYHMDGLVDVQAAICIAISFAVGAAIGADLVRFIPAMTLRVLFGLLLIYIGMRFIVATDSQATKTAYGLTVVCLSFFAYLAMRAVGRHYQRKSLQEAIENYQVDETDEPEYYI